MFRQGVAKLSPDRAKDWIDKAVASGAKMLCGGLIIDDVPILSADHPSNDGMQECGIGCEGGAACH